ncbi:MAG: AMP-binding protein, partial [Actinomycetota bacterium]|nr:AMP-binding protein [Actinomycetota bacterium]
MAELSRLVAGDWIRVGARRWPSAACLVDGDGASQTFAETADRVDGLAGALIGAGLTKGDRLALLATDSWLHVELVLACMRIGVVFCDLNYRLREDELINIARTARPRALAHEQRYADVAAAIGSATDTLELTFVIDTDSPSGAGEATALSAGADPSAAPQHSAAGGEDLVSIAFTSGTTGTPKGVMQSERMIRNIIYSGVREMNIQPGGFRYAGAPLFHISGIGSVLYAIAGGCASLILSQFDAPTVLRWMQTGGLTHCLLIPTMISELLALPGAETADYPSLRTVMYGGAPMSPALVRRTFNALDCDLFNGFGAGTEAGGQTMLGPEEHRAAMSGREHLLSSIGKPILGVDLRLCDENLDDVEPGEIGEIVTRSETVMSGYLDQPDLTAESVVDGWFRAGDMAYADEEGYLYLATRRADMIIRGGENVYPVEIESTLAEHPEVAAAVVVGVPDDHWGEIVGAAIITRSDIDMAVDELQQFCRERLGSYKVPEVIEFFE